MRYSYVSIDRIFNKVSRDLGEGNIKEADIIEWTGEALEFIGAVNRYEEAVAFIDVTNHQCELPKGLHAIIQVARNTRWSPQNKDMFCPQQVSTALQTEQESETVNFVPLDCEGKPITDYEVAYYRPFFNLQYEYFDWRKSNLYSSCYQPVRLSNHSFFNSLVCKEGNSEELYNTIRDEYTVIKGQYLRFSFPEGQIALAYLKQMVDEETGFPLIPDHISYTTAIVKYLTLKITERQFYAGREGSQTKVQKAEQDWHWYCKQAGNVDAMIHGEDEHQNYLEQRSYILPRQNRYYGFFGKLSHPEGRKFNDPDSRNRFY